MAPKQVDEILRRVPANRRNFLRGVLAGAAFVTPLLSSFSMGGLTLNAADAAGPVCSYMVLTTNTKPAPGTMTYVPNMFASLSNQYQARLTADLSSGSTTDGPRKRGVARLTFDPIKSFLTVRWNAMVTGQVTLVLVQVPSYNWTLKLNIRPNVAWITGAELATLSMAASEPACNFAALAQAMADGLANVRFYIASSDSLVGTLLPA